MRFPTCSRSDHLGGHVCGRLAARTVQLAPVRGRVGADVATSSGGAYQVLSNKQSNLNAFIHESIADENHADLRQEAVIQNLPGAKERRAHFVDEGWWPVPHVAGHSDHFRRDDRVHLSTIGSYGLWRGERFHRRADRVRRVGQLWNPVKDMRRDHLFRIFGAYFSNVAVQPDFDARPRQLANPHPRGQLCEHAFGRNILNLVDLHVEPGSTVALVGPTGPAKPRSSFPVAFFTFFITIDVHDVFRSRWNGVASADGRHAAGYVHSLWQCHRVRQAGCD